MATIDLSIVERLVAAQLETVSGGVRTLYRGDPDPLLDATAGGGDNVSVWCRLLACDLRTIPRQKGAGGSDMASLRVRLAVTAAATATKASTWALDAAMANVAKVLRETCLKDAATTHNVDLGFPELNTAPIETADNRAIAVGGISIEGTVTRVTGDTLETH